MTIKEARKAAGLTQQRMSDLLGIPKRTLENWESGKALPPEWAERMIVEKLEDIEREKNMYNLEEAAGKNALIMCCGEKTVIVANIEGIGNGMLPFVSPFGTSIMPWKIDGELSKPEPVEDIREELPGTVWMIDENTCDTDMDIAWDYNGDISALFGIRTGYADPDMYNGNYKGKVFYLDRGSDEEYKFIVPDCWD